MKRIKKVKVNWLNIILITALVISCGILAHDWLLITFKHYCLTSYGVGTELILLAIADLSFQGLYQRVKGE